MALQVTLGNKDYTFLVGYQDQQIYRAAFNKLVDKVFNISFEAWYQAGYWNEKYIPYTLFDGDRAVANVSVNIMDFDTFEEKKRYIQLGTVLTDEDYRNRKLSQFLMQHVLKEWETRCDFFYLFANSSVLELYPKFDFKRVREYAFFKAIPKKINCNGKIEKINMNLQANRDCLYDYAKNTKVFGKLSMRENADLVMFYCTSFLQENVYYLTPPLDAIVVAVLDDHQWHLWDVFAKHEIDLEQVIDSLSSLEADEIVLGFTPKDCSSYQEKEVVGEDTLFIQQGKTKLFDENKIMFPLLSHA